MMIKIKNIHDLKQHLPGFATAFDLVNARFVADVQRDAFFIALFDQIEQGGLFFIEYDFDLQPTFCAVFFPTGDTRLFLTLMYMREQDKYKLRSKLKKTLKEASREGYKQVEYESEKLGSSFERLMRRLGFCKKKVVYTHNLT